MENINKIFNDNCINTMQNITDKCIHGIITSPPYNITTKRKDCYYNNGYSEIDNLSESKYIETRISEFLEFDRILKDKGVILYNISYHNENPVLPTLLINEIHNKTSFTIADIITWEKSNAIPFQTSPTKLSRVSELIYVIVKKKHLHDFETNKEVSKIGKTGQKFYKNYTNIIKAKNNDGFKCKLKASYSTDLVKKLLNIYFKKGSIIYDPFTGIGTTQLACIEYGCSYLGSEIDNEIFAIAFNRLKTKLST